jgi:glucose-6-phosphate isomerase
MSGSHSNKTSSLAALASHSTLAREWRLPALFAQDKDRFHHFSLEAAGLFLDYSKNHIDATTVSLLASFARSCNLEQRRDAMFKGELVNTTEQRPALHTLLRAPAEQRFELNGEVLSSEVQQVFDRMDQLSQRVRSGEWLGFTGKVITDVVNIGIGGSDLGPAMACAALRPFIKPCLRVHFLSNVDGHAIDAVLAGLSPETTLFIIASKSFTTQETLINAHVAREWFLNKGKATDLAKHFVAVSTNAKAVAEFGIDTANMLPFWDWVGGRYSVWSAIGLSVAIAIGMENFRAFLAGAHAMDRHFQESPLEQNMPVILGLISWWYRQYFACTSHLIAPYHEDLRLFPLHLQQVDMESNGKRITNAGIPVTSPTAQVIWGSTGTNGQHAYFQMLHQGTDLVPVDFIAVIHPSHDRTNQHHALLANCFAQAEALMVGHQKDERQGHEGEALAEFRVLPGNRPSNTLLLDKLTPTTLGTLLALYEHKTFVQGVLWDINSFDQWGVERGKTLAARILPELEGKTSSHKRDGSTAGLIARILQKKS